MRGVGHVSFIDWSGVSCDGRIALNERISEIRQSTDAMHMPPLKGTAMLTRSVLFSCKSCICVGVEQKYSFQFIGVSTLKQVWPSVFSQYITEAFTAGSFKKTEKGKL